MDNRKAFNEFVAKVINGEESFVITADKDMSVHFMSCPHGAARYFFYCKQYGESNFRNLDNKYEIAAVYARNNIYVVDWFAFGIYSFEVEQNKEQFPDCVVDIDYFVKEFNGLLFNGVYPKYYEELQPTKANAEYLIEENMIKTARNILLGHKPMNYDTKSITGITRDRAVEMLCRDTTFLPICREVLDEQKELIDYLKSRETFINELIANGKAAAEWEIKLAEAIGGTSAKTVIAEFELNGKTAEAKIETERIMWNLIGNDYFSDYNFPTSVIGKQLIKELGASEYYYTPETNLYAKNIKSISFRGKKIYERCDG